jgi:hypothetical protein
MDMIAEALLWLILSEEIDQKNGCFAFELEIEPAVRYASPGARGGHLAGSERMLCNRFH